MTLHSGHACQTFKTAEETALWIDPQAFCEDLAFVEYHQGVLHIDGVSAKVLADTYKTPLYVYSQNAISKAYQDYTNSFSSIPHKVCYAVKANSNLSVLRLLAELGSGFDVVSKGELARVLQVTDGKGVVFSGVGKTKDDIVFALEAQIDCFNVEAMSELDLINEVAKSLGQKARISIRVNPDVDAKTHPYISTGLKENKFGIHHGEVLTAYLHAKSLTHLEIVGIDCHIGSQLTCVDSFVDALDKVIELIELLKQHHINLKHIDLGGGLGVRYTDENIVSVEAYAQALLPKLTRLGLTLYLEPGRYIVANAGVLLTTVDVLKPTPFKNFAIVDASMSEMMRPALYESVMAVLPIVKASSTASQALAHLNFSRHTWTLVGSVCESSDVLAKDRVFLDLQVGDVLALMGAGAYGFSMASNYNTRPRPAEVMASKGTHRLIRKRERLTDLWQLELE